ncbi:hypothetical protein CBD41_07615 [bacterium TMED181]|nr:hypothetical protein [Planctomycetota bacterium]OUW43146.1 MAG: hypothetical protein CBD41_07615 [bacterium TMED181]
MQFPAVTFGIAHLESCRSEVQLPGFLYLYPAFRHFRPVSAGELEIHLIGGKIGGMKQTTLDHESKLNIP